MIFIRRTAFGVGLLLSAVMACGGELAAAPVKLDIKAQPMADALNQWAQATGFQVIFPEETSTAGLVSPEVRGQYAPDVALTKLLANSGLRYEYLNDRTVAVRLANDQNQTENSAAMEADKSRSESKEFWKRLRVAQAEDDDKSEGMQKAQDANSSDSAKAETESKVQEIVVTAQRRNENLQDVPISISVLGGEQLDSSTASGLADALQSVPGLASSQNLFTGGTVNFAVRGVSNANPRSTGAGVIAYYLDGVPYGFVRSAYNPDPNVYDLDHVEFLSGPQGTLYGAGSLNGVLRVLTHDADVDEFELKARAFTSTTEDGADNQGGDAAVNIPLIAGVLGARAVVGFRDDGGWIDAPNRRDVNSNEATSYRLKLRAEPSNSLSIDFGIWRYTDEIGAPSFSQDNRTITSVQDQSGSQEFTTYALEVQNDFTVFTLSSITSLVDFNNHSNVDGSPPPSNVTGVLRGDWNSEVFAQEINLVSDVQDTWRWSAGVFYRRAEEDIYQLLDRINPALADTVNNDYADESVSYAIYGEVGRDLTDDLQLAVGLRYFRDDGQMTLEKSYTNATTGITFPAGAEFDSESEAVTPRVVLTWMPSEDQTFYASYSQGFRSGMAQQPNVQVAYPEFGQLDPDRLTNYEIGNKGYLFAGRLSYRAAAFYTDWQDVQQAVGVRLPTSGISTNAQINGDSASGVGVELALATRLFDRLELGLTGSWNDLTTDDAIVRENANGTDTVLYAPGDRLEFSPEYTVGVNGAYGWSLGAHYAVRIAVAANYSSPEIEKVNIAAGNIRPSDDLLIANARLSLDADNWRLTLFGDNLTDESGTTKPIDVLDWSPRRRPMTIGLQLEANF